MLKNFRYIFSHLLLYGANNVHFLLEMENESTIPTFRTQLFPFKSYFPEVWYYIFVNYLKLFFQKTGQRNILNFSKM